MHNPQWVYILASSRNGTLYVGSTGDLLLRLQEHREGHGSHFVRKYGVHTLVYFEPADTISDALHREHQLKRWRRQWKLELIASMNPDWRDLTERLREGSTVATERHPGSVPGLDPGSSAAAARASRHWIPGQAREPMRVGCS